MIADFLLPMANATNRLNDKYYSNTVKYGEYWHGPSGKSQMTNYSFAPTFAKLSANIIFQTLEHLRQRTNIRKSPASRECGIELLLIVVRLSKINENARRQTVAISVL